MPNLTRTLSKIIRNERDVHAPVRRVTLSCPRGKRFREVSPDGCDDTVLVEQVGGPGAPQPGFRYVQLAPFGGGAGSVVPLAPSGLGSTSVAATTESSLAFTTAPSGTYRAFYRDSSTELTVKDLDGAGAVSETALSGITVPTGVITENFPNIALIANDDSVPDKSFTLCGRQQYDDLYVVNGNTGSFTKVWSGDSGTYDEEHVLRRGTYYDAENKLLMIAAQGVPSGGIEPTQSNLYKVATDGTGGALVSTFDLDTVSPFDDFAITALWSTDRLVAVVFRTFGGFIGCINHLFDGTSPTHRPGDIPLHSTTLS